ncbi:FAD-dependent oxidoreductase [Aspergillus stella-maris]|uniref:FAD-dependent oxidoreductase n=1 Tax=Aspergillus stella-maris TaxID=1810926 RepID=UPI003CCD04C8
MRLLSLSVVGATVTAAAASPSTSCRCFPGDECWPSLSTWGEFNKSIDGQLIATAPLGLPCHDPTYDEEICTLLRTGWTDPEPHYQSSSSIMAPFFANASCDPFQPVSKPCSLGNYISYAVNVSSASQVSKTLSFAKEHNIRLVIRNTGHDYQGKSTGAGGLGLWMHHLKDLEFKRHKDRYYTGPALKMGAGVQGFEAYAAADENGYQVVGGECPSVGIAGGYTQGGGHSALSSRYGLGADQALAWEVVDGQGRHIIATRDNEHRNLYWALTGGGGGTYAVVLSLTVKVHPSTPVSGLNLTFSRTGLSRETYYTAISTYQSTQAKIVDAGGMAITTFTNESFILSPVTGPDIPVDKLLSLLQPWISTLDFLGIKYEMHSAQFPTYLSQFTGMQGFIPVGIAQYGGWLIPRSVVLNRTADLTSAFENIVEDGGTVINVALDVSQKVSGDVDNAVLPAWREALVHSTLTTVWDWTDVTAMKEAQRKMTEEYVPLLQRLAPRSGAYLNEGDFQQPDFQTAFYGRNYERLRSTKSVYDPHDLFYALTGVGSDDWKQKADGRLCRVGNGGLEEEGFGLGYSDEL